MVSAFRDMSSLLGIEADASSNNSSDMYSNDADVDQSEVHESESAESAGAEALQEDELEDVMNEIDECHADNVDQVLDYIGGIVQKRIPCCIHTVQLVVIDGLKAAKFMGNVQSKASRLSTLLHTSGTFQEKYFSVFDTTVPKMNSTRWNSMYLQLAAIVKLDFAQLHKVLSETKNDVCIFTKREFEILKEVVDVLEPAYDATIIMEEESALISLVAPSVAALHKKWSGMVGNVKFSDPLIVALLASLERRFIGLLINIGILLPQKTADGQPVDTATLNFGDPAYLVAAALDPEFKLRWLSNDDEDDNVKVGITGKFQMYS